MTKKPNYMLKKHEQTVDWGHKQFIYDICPSN